MWTPLLIHLSLTAPPALDTALGGSSLEVRTAAAFISAGSPYL